MKVILKKPWLSPTKTLSSRGLVLLEDTASYVLVILSALAKAVALVSLILEEKGRVFKPGL